MDEGAFSGKVKTSQVGQEQQRGDSEQVPPGPLPAAEPPGCSSEGQPTARDVQHFPARCSNTPGPCWLEPGEGHGWQSKS